MENPYKFLQDPILNPLLLLVDLSNIQNILFYAKYQDCDDTNGRKPFRRFKDVLCDAPEERERWFAFKRDCIAERVRVWLRNLEIEFVEVTRGP